MSRLLLVLRQMLVLLRHVWATAYFETDESYLENCRIAAYFLTNEH
jgi:hypothetical protein